MLKNPKILRRYECIPKPCTDKENVRQRHAMSIHRLVRGFARTFANENHMSENCLR